MPARFDTSTSASGSVGRCCAPEGLPKIRLMQAGMYTAAAPWREVAGRLGGAGGGIDAANDGTSSPLTRDRSASETTRAPGTRSPARAAFSTDAHRLAIP